MASNSHSRKFQDLTGRRFGKLVVIGLAARAKETGGVTKWTCRCDCGKESQVWANSLTTGSTRSCGCLKREQEKLSRPQRVKHHCSVAERSLIYRKKYRESGRAAETARKWRKRNLEASRLTGKLGQQKRRTRELSSGTGITRQQWVETLEVFASSCAYCLAPGNTMEHIVPLSRGGTHDADNIVPACKSCNFSKHNRSLLEFVKRGGGTV